MLKIGGVHGPLGPPGYAYALEILLCSPHAFHFIKLFWKS